jgi:hypothetical protein
VLRTPRTLTLSLEEKSRAPAVVGPGALSTLSLRYSEGLGSKRARAHAAVATPFRSYLKKSSKDL